MNFLKYLIYPAVWLTFCAAFLLSPLEYRWISVTAFYMICLSYPPKSLEVAQAWYENSRRLAQQHLSEIDKSSSFYAVSVCWNKVVYYTRKPSPIINDFLHSAHPAVVIEKHLPFLSTSIGSAMAVIIPFVLAPLLLESFVLYQASKYSLIDPNQISFVFGSLESTTYCSFALTVFLLSKLFVTRKADAYIGVGAFAPLAIVLFFLMFDLGALTNVDKLSLIGLSLFTYGVVVFFGAWVYHFVRKSPTDGKHLNKLLLAARSPMILVNVTLFYSCFVLALYTIQHEVGHSSYDTRSFNLLQSQASAEGYYLDLKELEVQPVTYVNILDALEFKRDDKISLPLSLLYIVRESSITNWVDGLMFERITRMPPEDMEEYATFVLNYFKESSKPYMQLGHERPDLMLLDVKIATEIFSLLSEGKKSGFAAIYEKYKSDFENTSANKSVKPRAYNMYLKVSYELLIKLTHIDDYKADFESVKMVTEQGGFLYNRYMSNKDLNESTRKDFIWLKSNRTAIDALIKQNATRPDTCTVEQLYCIPDVIGLALK